MPNVHFHDLTILTVDDNGYMLGILRECLKAFGAKKVIESSDVVDALEMTRTVECDLIIVDYLMQPLDGLELVKIMRAQKDAYLREMPIILLTAHTERKIVLEARKAGVSDILQKPVSAAALYDHIMGVMNSSRIFVNERSFKGPDRRRDRKVSVPWDGVDRRS